ncbi:MAG: nitrate ABC transporter substrate-binding protein, partial [Mixta calida]|nr:nitrate ABC transporter substrate-binding protein [Mixta calida]
RTDIYRQAASAVGNIAVPQSEMRSSTLIDGRVWDGSDPAAWATGFAIKR